MSVIDPSLPVSDSVSVSPSSDADDGLRTPLEHAKVSVPGDDSTPHVRIGAISVGGMKRDAYSADYRAAEVVHGWSVHGLHTATPLRISREDFDLALKAVQSPDERGQYTPHKPACSPHSTFRAPDPPAAVEEPKA